MSADDTTPAGPAGEPQQAATDGVQGAGGSAAAPQQGTAKLPETPETEASAAERTRETPKAVPAEEDPEVAAEHAQPPVGGAPYQPYGAPVPPRTPVRERLGRTVRNRAVQFIGVGLAGFVIGGGVVAAVGAFVHDDEHGTHWQQRNGVYQQWERGIGPNQGPGFGFGGFGDGSGSNGPFGDQQPSLGE